ncbi:MAG: tryptophan 2,3-dioxygenase [Proteobacteria bacterium]|nr:tryptophan 2,3-dioxygenase [Pseudomonadota bacterium]
MATPSYWDYLKLQDLLNLQGGLEDDESQLGPDELHFIVVHQAFELWFKLTLNELRLARDHLAAPHVPEQHIPHVVHHLRRANTILQLCADQFGVMETLTPQDFLAFRDKLIPSSGFQSFQMREVELLCGLADGERVDSGFGDPLAAIRRMGKGSEAGEYAIARLEAAMEEQSLRDALHAWLWRTPIQGSAPGDPGDEAAITAFVDRYLESMGQRYAAQIERLVGAGVMERAAAETKFNGMLALAGEFLRAEGAEDPVRLRRIRAAIVFIESYRELPLLAWPRLLLETVVEMESRLVLFRSRHARMVERIIGRRVGTGGSAGVDYLDNTTKYRVFKELWAVRTILLPRDAVPTLQQADAYGFVDEAGISSVRIEATT